MKVIYDNYKNISIDGNTAVALGFFDGVHGGHQSLITKLKDMSGSDNLLSTVFTFSSHPLSLIEGGRSPKLIMDNELKAEAFERLEIDIAYFEVITRDFLNIEPEDFLYNVLLEKFHVRAIAAGFNFRFGRNSRGDCRMLQKFGRAEGVRIHIADPYYTDGYLVSSTTIRGLLEEGSIKLANRLLGHEFSMRGRVVHGKMMGRKMGFPTVNFYPESSMVSPKNGVYVTKVYFEGLERIGITNIGCNPTFNDKYLTVETYILDFEGDLYDKNIELRFFERIRDEKKYDSMDELSSRLNLDREFARNYFAI